MTHYLEAMVAKKQSTPQHKSDKTIFPAESDSDADNDLNGNINEDEMKKHSKPKTDNKKQLTLLQTRLGNDDEDVMDFGGDDDA